MSSTSSSSRDENIRTKIVFPNFGKIFFSPVGLLLLTIPGLFLGITFLGRTVKVSTIDQGDSVRYLHKDDVVYLNPDTSVTMTLRSAKPFVLILADGTQRKSQGPRYDMLFGTDLQISGRTQEGFRVSEATDFIYMPTFIHSGGYQIKSSVGFPAIDIYYVDFISFLIRGLLVLGWAIILMDTSL